MTDLDLHLHYADRINYTYVNDLRRLFYCNSKQQMYHDQIVEVVEKYGDPQIIIDSSGFATFYLDKCPDAKTLYVSSGPVLLGVFIYRQNSDSIDIIQATVEQNDRHFRNYSAKVFFVKVVEYFKELARSSIGDGANVRFLYNGLVLDVN